MMPKRSMLVAVVSAVILAGPSVSTAFAGEITGNGKPTAGVANANSICVFSGKNDDPTGIDPEQNGPPGVSQSYGQENKLGLVDPQEFNPGDACRGGSNFAREE
jgi:hypothetical protein